MMASTNVIQLFIMTKMPITIPSASDAMKMLVLSNQNILNVSWVKKLE